MHNITVTWLAGNLMKSLNLNMKNVLLRGSQSVVFFSLRHFDLQNNETIWVTKIWTCHLKDPKTKRYRCKWNSKKKQDIPSSGSTSCQLADICGSGFGGFLLARDIKNSWILQSCVLASFSAFKNHSQSKSHCQFPLHLECSSWCQFLFPSLSAHWRSSDNSYQNEGSICIDKIAVCSRSCLISVSNQSFKFMALMDLIWSSFQLWSWIFRWGERKVGNTKQDMQLPPVCFFSAPAPEATILLHQCQIKAFFTG